MTEQVIETTAADWRDPSRLKVTLQEAMEMLTIAEVRAIERYYGKSFDSGDISGTDLTVAVIWAHERRRLQGYSTVRPDWKNFEDWTLKDLNSYFAADEIETDPADPETESGKGHSHDA